MLNFLNKRKDTKSSSEIYIKRNRRIIKDGISEYCIHSFAEPHFIKIGQNALEYAARTYTESTFAEHIYAISKIYGSIENEIEKENNLLLSNNISTIFTKNDITLYNNYLAPKEDTFNNLFSDLSSFTEMINTILNCTRTKSKISFLYYLSNYNDKELKNAINKSHSSTTHVTDLTNLASALNKESNKLYIYYFSIHNGKITFYINTKFIPKSKDIIKNYLSTKKNINCTYKKYSTILRFDELQNSLITIADLLVLIEKDFL